ncbi:MAG TPA: divalent metal cation transporter [Acidobacteria bacterium]|nr:divalent metal cation transporter [Acidobacteriota bacterium]HIM15179.1 divalent metal cation transporter [Acidobacteriota bacterium]HIN92074.1 divalent metal cation transporter [Alphaproteobacteria bacterium]
MADVRVDDSSEPLNQLPLPDISPRGLLRSFGPGMLLMMTGIGTSHLLTAPAAGGRFEYALLWCIPVAYIFKYYGFEMAFRFTNATGRSMLDAYSTAPGKWPLWYVLITTFIQCALGQAGRLIAAAAVCYAFANIYLGIDLPLGVYGAILGVAAVLFILLGRYAVMETVTKFLAGLLFVSTVGVYFVQPAPLSAFTHFVQFEIPGGSWLVIAAFLGLLPTGIDVSLQASEWGKAKKAGMGRIREALEQRGLAPKFDPMSSTKEDLAVDMERLPSHAREYCRRWFRIGELDFGFGHVVSFSLACIFLLLAAVWMYPSEVDGRAVIGEIGSIFNDSVGPAMMIVFFVGAFAATFSTAFNYFDGWPRVVGACCRNLFRKTAALSGIARDEITQEHRGRWYSEFNIYRMTMFYSLVASVAIIAGLPRPVFLVLIASALAFFVAPVIFFLNIYYCVTVIPKTDPVFYPSPAVRAFAWTSFVVFSGLTALIIMARVFDITLFGGPTLS